MQQNIKFIRSMRKYVADYWRDTQTNSTHNHEILGKRIIRTLWDDEKAEKRINDIKRKNRTPKNHEISLQQSFKTVKYEIYSSLSTKKISQTNSQEKSDPFHKITLGLEQGWETNKKMGKSQIGR